MFKKIIAVLLTAALILSFAACGKKEKEPTEPIEAPTKKVAVLVAPRGAVPPRITKPPPSLPPPIPKP